jgi:hypothetical protein
VGREAAISKDTFLLTILIDQKQQSFSVALLLSLQKLVPLTEFPSFNGVPFSEMTHI